MEHNRNEKDYERIICNLFMPQVIAPYSGFGQLFAAINNRLVLKHMKMPSLVCVFHKNKTMKPSKKNNMQLLIIFFLCTILAAGISAAICRSTLRVRKYELTMEGVEHQFTAVCITDLHGREFGQDNVRLLKQVRIQQPDVVFTLGDLISRNASGNDLAQMCELLKALQEIAPVYSSLGNHEEDYMQITGQDVRPILCDTGAVLLNEECQVTEIAGNSICLGGTLGHLYPDKRSTEEYHNSPEFRLMTQMQASGLPTIVLSHRPDTIIFDKAYENWYIDLFLSGHTHGGLIRLPLIGGLYAPKQGFFPKFDQGLFSIGNTRLLISGGFAGYGPFPRIFNRPEICVLRIIPAE